MSISGKTRLQAVFIAFLSKKTPIWSSWTSTPELANSNAGVGELQKGVFYCYGGVKNYNLKFVDFNAGVAGLQRRS
jgi:hypothetical protein